MNPTDSSLFQSISWRHLIVMTAFQSLTASYGDSHERGFLLLHLSLAVLIQSPMHWLLELPPSRAIKVVL